VVHVKGLEAIHHQKGLSRPFGLQENRLGPRRDKRKDVLWALLQQAYHAFSGTVAIVLALPPAFALAQCVLRDHLDVSSL
jgi:hypothetical protein